MRDVTGNVLVRNPLHHQHPSGVPSSFEEEKLDEKLILGGEWMRRTTDDRWKMTPGTSTLIE